jgi:NAD(P)-dependent dehydrogenase (short-subunit alcohol dehydrogenase family)
MRRSRSYIRWAAWAKSRTYVDAVLFLESASFVTSEILHVDGGQSAGH